jgi:hypothetical protein
MPGQVTFPGTPELDPNTTTLAVLSTGARVDTSVGWAVSNAAPDGSYAVLSRDQDMKFYVTTPHQAFADARSLGCSGATFCDILGFLPNGHQIELSQDGRLYFVDPATLARSAGLKLPFRPELTSNARVGDPAQGRIAFVGTKYAGFNTVEYISLFDTATGKEVAAIDKSQVPNLGLLTNPGGQSGVLAWLP